MTPRKKAEELIEKFKDHVNPYIGSGMLSNTYDDEAILWQSKHCALITVEELILEAKSDRVTFGRNAMSDLAYWKEVKNQLNQM